MVVLNPKYKPLFAGETRFYIIIGGRGSGKSFGAGTFTCLLSFEEGQRILYTRQTMSSAHLSIIPEFKEKIELMDADGKFAVNKTEIANLDSGSDIIFKGIQSSSGSNTAQLKSLTGISCWLVDEAEELVQEDVFDKVNLSVRQKGVQNRVIIMLNPAKKKHWIYKRFFEPFNIPNRFNGVVGNVTYIHTTYLDNLDNLDPSFIEEMEQLKLTNLRKYNHLGMGDWVDNDEEQALWKDALIVATRSITAPPLRRIVVAIDPAVTSKDTSDETGIVVAGLGVDNRLYVLEDLTGRYTPAQWSTAAVAAFNKWKADRIIGEVNNGGDLIEATLRTVDRNIPYRGVHATRDKFTRAEPVASLWETGQASIVGRLVELEYEMTTWEAKKGQKSPNRIDALVWAAAELMPDLTKPKRNTAAVRSMFG